MSLRELAELDATLAQLAFEEPDTAGVVQELRNLLKLLMSADNA